MNAPVLRFGIVLDGARLATWQAAVLEALAASGDADLACVVIGERPASGTRPGALWRLLSNRLSPSRASRSVATAPWLQGVAIVRIKRSGLDASATGIADEDIKAIADLELDVIIGFGSDDLHEPLRGAARYGVWSFRHGDQDRYGGGPPGFWELVDGRPAVGVVLVCRTTESAGAVTLKRGWFAVAPQSYGLTRDRMLFGSSGWPAKVCRALRHGTIQLAELTAAPPQLPDRRPEVGAIARCIAASGRALARKAWHHGLRHDDWNIGVIDAPVESFLDGRAIPNVDWAPEQRGHYAADPFGRWAGSDLEVQYEDYEHAAGVASIARRSWTRERGWQPSSRALDIGSHLSYPFPLEHEGRRLMLPESRASGRLALYEADDAGMTWHEIADLGLDQDVADATLLHHDGRWWLFAVRADRLNPATELMLWYADRPEGPWREHPGNPVVVDVRSARPGGPFFRADDHVYRPAQDCSTGYGDRLAIKRVVSLTTTRYEEELVCVLEPERGGAYAHGLHTLTGVGDVTLVDGKRWVWDTTATIRGVRRRLPF